MFSNYSNLKIVVLSDKHTLGISGNAFNNCTSLERLTISSNCYFDRGGILSYCTNLKYLTISQNENVTKIPTGMFRGVQVDKLIIYDGMQELAEESFFDASFSQYILLPKSINLIEHLAFGGVRSEKGILLYEGTQDEWNAIEKEDSAVEINYNIYFYSDVEPVNTGNYWHYVSGEPMKW